MGRSLAWFIVESTDIDHVVTALDVKRTGRLGPPRSLPLCARTLPDGRVLVVSENCEEPQFKAQKLALVSRLGRTFSGALEEHVNLFELSLELTRRCARLDPDGDFVGDAAGDFEQLDVGFWRRGWQKTFWWRLAFLFLGGVALFVLALYGIARVLVWIMERLGWR